MGKRNWGKRACAVFVLCASTAIALRAQTLTTLVNFDGTNGASPYLMSLIQGTDGNLYGTTPFGGASNYGTVFKVTPAGTLTTLYSFCVESNCTDGAYPNAGLVLGSDGSSYGTTYQGGANGGGTVFKITSGGALTILHSFDGTGGGNPYAALVQATDGNFYGTTFDGGANRSGTVFEITPAGALTTVHSFDGTDGSEPFAGLIQATNGNFYGTTVYGGANNVGTVFEIGPGGALTTLHSFTNTDGANPDAALVQAANGRFYGTTVFGGANNDGTVFEITAGGTLTDLHNFDVSDGVNPNAALVQGSDVNLYGTTDLGGGGNPCDGTFGCGTVFRITPSGALTTLHSFDSTDGGYVSGGLIQATNGRFYGTTLGGGVSGYGTVFSLSVGLRPFVQLQPAIGKVGQGVRILGTNLTGATSVTFNGTPAVFHVVSPSSITATVPTGATSGKVQVVTPGGTLSSNVPFRVRP